MRNVLLTLCAQAVADDADGPSAVENPMSVEIGLPPQGGDD
jgi:hypothetical protein